MEQREVEKQKKEFIELEPPKYYKVYLLNDDYTTMDFVVDILIRVFRKSADEAQSLMLEIHNNNQALCGIYTKEIAYTKASEVEKQAREAGFPLKTLVMKEK